MSDLCEFMSHLCRILEILGPTFNLSTGNSINFSVLLLSEKLHRTASLLAHRKLITVNANTRYFRFFLGDDDLDQYLLCNPVWTHYIGKNWCTLKQTFGNSC